MGGVARLPVDVADLTETDHPVVVLPLSTTMNLAAPDVQILQVHQHPSFSRKVCLWLAGRRRPHRRKHYKRYVRHAATRRGLGEVAVRVTGPKATDT
jgi:hypothetical protein